MSTLDSAFGQPVFRNAPRIQRSLTASVEKRLLVWMAERTPQRIHSDHLTALGFAAQILAGAAYAAAGFTHYALIAASVFIFLNWLGDSLDGSLARVRNRQRPRYGFYVDHVIDAFGAAAMMFGMGFSGYLDLRVALGMLIAFLVVSIESYLATYTLGRFHMSHGIFGPTELRILLVIGNLVLLFRPEVHLVGSHFRLFDVGGVVAIAGMTVMAITAAVRHTRELYRQETTW